MLYYEYVVSAEDIKLGMILPLTNDELDKLLKKGIAVEI